MNETLVVIGAGPKGIAIAAKWTAFRASGYGDLPKLIVIDGARQAGSHWDGTNGYTDGNRLLCTPPTHDLGYPYLDKDQKVRDYMLANFSWQAYQTGLGRYHHWVDRDEPRPTHIEWQQYLAWAKRKCNGVKFMHGRVMSIRAGRDWTIATQDREIVCKRLVLTGPGEPTRIPTFPSGEHQRVLDGRNFWHELSRMDDFFKIPSNEQEDHPLAIIGSGGTAATIVAGLVERTRAPINVVSRSATLYARSENYFETTWLSNPSDWSDLPLPLRRTLVQRIDRGVISAQNMQIIKNADNVMHQRMSVNRIQLRNRMPIIIGEVESFDMVSGSTTHPIELPADFVVDAGGFNLWWFTDLFVGELRELFANKDFRRIAEIFIDFNLEISFQLLREQLQRPETDASALGEETIKAYLNSIPRMNDLHLAVPMLAGLAQGPGFPNLTCLGLLSGRILDPFVSI